MWPLLAPFFFAGLPQVQEGLTLYSPQGTTESYLMDEQHQSVHTWTGSASPGAMAYLSPEGHLLRLYQINGLPGSALGGSGGGLREYSWDNQLLWDVSFATQTTLAHHDLALLPNGNVLMLVWENVGRNAAIAAGRDPAYLNGADFWSDTVIEVERGTGNIVWEWKAWDHVIQDADPAKPAYGVISDAPERLDVNYPARRVVRNDWLHLNSIDYNPALDQILISSKEWNEIWVLDHSTTSAEAAGHTGGQYGKGGDLLYRWGNAQTYDRGLPADQWLFGQHDATWIPPESPGEGNILFFNNGAGRTTSLYSSVEEITPPVDATGAYPPPPSAAFGPFAPHWSWTDSPPTQMYSSGISGCQRQPNGNTLICSGQNGRLLEINAAGVILEDFTPAPGKRIFKTRRYQEWLWPKETEISSAVGGQRDLHLLAGSAYAGRPYLIVGSMSGIKPGTTLGNGLHVPLNADSFTQYVLQHANQPGMMGFQGSLDAQGAATAVLDSLGPIQPALVGQTLSFAFLTLNSTDFSSNPIAVVIQP